MKTVLITGTTSGFGQMMVGEFLRAGYKVIATGRNLKSRTDIFVIERTRFPNRLLEIDLDITDHAQRQKLVQTLEEKGKSIDVLVNNAGRGLFGPFEEVSEEQCRNQFEVNFFGTLFLTQELLPFLRKSKGKIINLSSVLGFVTLPLTSVYCASKHAIEGWSDALSLELNPLGIQVCLVQPGGFGTQFNKNVEWGTREITTEANIYEKMRKKFQQGRKNQGLPEWLQNPQRVAQKVVRLAEMQCAPLRTTVGVDGGFARFASAILPRQWFHKLMQWLARKMIL